MVGILEQEISSMSSDVLSSNGPFEMIKHIKQTGEDSALALISELESKEKKPVLSHMMYYLKYFEKFLPDFAKAVEKMAIDEHHKHNNFWYSLPYAVQDFNRQERKVIYSALNSVQFVSGCGSGCNFCGLDAVVGVRDRVSFGDMITLIKDISDNKGKAPSLYWANDGLEIVNNAKEFWRLKSAYAIAFKQHNGVRTSIPKGTEELYKELITSKFNPQLDVSLTSQNVERLNAAGIVKVKFLQEIKSFRQDQTQHDGLDAVQWPKVMAEIFTQGMEPRSVSIKFEETLKGVGVNRYATGKRAYSICPSSGVIITPYGVHNFIDAFRTSERYPQSLIVVPVSKLGDSPINPLSGERVEQYLRNTIVSSTIQGKWEVRTFELANLQHKAIIKVNTEGIIVN